MLQCSRLSTSTGPEKVPFTAAVRLNNTLYLSGALGIPPGTRQLVEGGIQPETRQTLEKLQVNASIHAESPYRIAFQNPDKTSNPLFQEG